MRHWTRAIAALTLAAATPAAAQPDSIGSILRDYQAVERDTNPIGAGRRGDAQALRRWPDVSPAALADRNRRLAEINRRLDAIPAASLTGGEALDRGLLANDLAMELEAFPFGGERIPFISGDGFFTTADYTAINTAIRTEADALAWIARLEALPAYWDANIANMRRGMAAGFTQPALTVERAIASIESQATPPAAESGLLTPFRTLPATIPAARQAELRTQALAIVETRIRPAQRALIAFFRNDYLPAVRRQVGVSATPNGRAYYDHLIRRHTTTRMTAEQIHQLGLDEITRIRAEMQRVMTDAQFTGTLPEFLTFMRTDRRFYATSIEQYIEIGSEIAKRIDMQVGLHIGRLPRLPFGLRRLPPEVANTSSGYWEGDPETGRAGSIIIHNERVLSFSLAQLPAWVAHEGVPGHHTQIALAQELTGVSDFRRDVNVTAYTEGWGLYAERMAGEMGIYRTPYERFGQLSYEAWRASRLVVDTGMHAFGWSRDRAVAYLRDHTALSDIEINNEIDRYIAWPGQALAYKIGEITIRRLRARAEQSLGDRFDIRAFHDAVLANGPVTLEMLDAQMAAWEQTQR